MTINCKGKLIDLSTPKVMGILNLTSDSFYKESRFHDKKQILHKVERMLADGATWIDLGAYSSRPGAADISPEEESDRLIRVVELLVNEFRDILLSIDTFRASIAQEAIHAGAAMINDISAGQLDENMMETVARLQVPYIMMHMRGTPQTMKTMTSYEDVVKETLFYFSQKIEQGKALGINDLIVDPGFGFAKNIDQNFEILNKLNLYKNLDLPVLIGLSRKSTIYKTLKTNAEHALNGTTVLHTVALLKGVSILRVHDVKEAVEAITLIEKTKGTSSLLGS